MKRFRAFLVDVKNETVTEVQVDDTVEAYNRLIGSSCYTGGPRLRNRDGFLVDDEGLLKLTPQSKFFTFKGYPQPLVGNGLLLGCASNGHTRDVKSDIDEIRKDVKFFNLNQVQNGEWKSHV